MQENFLLSRPSLFSHLRVLFAVALKDWKQYWRYPLNAVSSVFQPIIWLSPIYFMGKAFSVNGQAQGFAQYSGTPDFMSFILIGTILGNFINAVFWGMGYSLKEDMDSGVMESNWLTPIPRLLILVGHSLTNLAITTITSALMLVVATLVFGFHANGDVLKAFIPVIPMLVGLYGFGFAFAALVLVMREANTGDSILMSAEAPALDVTVETAGPCSKILRIKVPAARVDHEIEQTYKNVQKTVQFPGFRPGKAPRKLVEARLGERVMQEVLERLVQNAYDEAVDSTKLKTIGAPRLKDPPTIARGTDLAISIDVDVRPEFALPKLEDLTATRPLVDITDVDVETEIKRLRDERATVADAGDEPIAESGIANLHVKVSVGDQVLVEADDVEWQHPSDVLGGMLVANLATTLLGKKKGDTAAFTETLPADFRDEQHRGKESTIELRVDGVQRVTLPVVDDAFAAEMDYDSLDEMKAEVKAELGKRAGAQIERMTDDAVAESLLAAAPFDVPPSLVESETEKMLRRYEMQLRQQSIPEESIPKLMTEARAQAETRVKRDLRLSFLLDTIATERKVFVTENEIRHEVSQIAARYEKSVPEMEDYMERNRLLPALRSELRDRKALGELRKIVKITDAPKAPEAAK